METSKSDFIWNIYSSVALSIQISWSPCLPYLFHVQIPLLFYDPLAVNRGGSYMCKYKLYPSLYQLCDPESHFSHLWYQSQFHKVLMVVKWGDSCGFCRHRQNWTLVFSLGCTCQVPHTQRLLVTLDTVSMSSAGSIQCPVSMCIKSQL